MLHVLPLTREWIEMSSRSKIQFISTVLPLTREWIEMEEFAAVGGGIMFSLLRGSGLKFAP